MISTQDTIRALVAVGLGASLAGCASSLETTWYYIPVAEPPLARVEALGDGQLGQTEPSVYLGRFVPAPVDARSNKATSGDANLDDNPNDKTDSEKIEFQDVPRVSLEEDKGWGHPGLFVRLQSRGRKPFTITYLKLDLDGSTQLPVPFEGPKTLKDRNSALLVSLGLDGCALNGVLEVTLEGEEPPRRFSYDGAASAAALREFRHDPNCRKLLEKRERQDSDK